MGTETPAYGHSPHQNLVHTRGGGWGPLSSFVLRINAPFMEYVCRHTMKLQVSDLEALTRAIEAMGD